MLIEDSVVECTCVLARVTLVLFGSEELLNSPSKSYYLGVLNIDY